jgi:hypothetical protein
VRALLSRHGAGDHVDPCFRAHRSAALEPCPNMVPNAPCSASAGHVRLACGGQQGKPTGAIIVTHSLLLNHGGIVWPKYPFWPGPAASRWNQWVVSRCGAWCGARGGGGVGWVLVPDGAAAAVHAAQLCPDTGTCNSSSATGRGIIR